LLATLRYVIDEKTQRGCGETSKGYMSQSDFLRHVLGRRGRY
jgi:hypothetical protein